jgi:HlyD family secretion protein/epimerase transport system membrane fusion protein
MNPMTLEIIGKPDLLRWIVSGYLIIATFLLTFGTWAGMVPIDAATVVQGTIEIRDKRKTIQHLEGGIVREIFVKEHSKVQNNQLLIRLDKTRAQASLDLVRNQYLAAQALEARLLAEKNGAPHILWPKKLAAGGPLAQAAISEQQGIFQKRSTSHRGKIELLENSIFKSKQALNGSIKQLASLKKQFQLISNELENTRQLVDKGLTTKQQLLSLEREKLSIEERLSSLETRIASGKYEIEAGQLQISNLKNTYNDEVAELLHQARLNLSDLSQKLKSAMDLLARTDIVSPRDGVVINLAVTTLGSVIRSGDTIMEIVPSDAIYTVETKIAPTDIDVVEKGSLTRIKLTSYKQRITPTLEGKVINVSADSLFDEKKGNHYYSAVIEINPESLQKNPGLRLYPGMPADIMIVSDSRTVIEYLFQPVIESFRHAFREK